MFTRTLTAFALSVLAFSAAALSPLVTRSPAYSFLGGSLHKRTLTGQSVAFACYGGGGDCECPSDLNGDSGVLINVFPGYQCAYPNGACTWDDETGALQNTGQTNCPSTATCSKTGGCSCPKDNNGDAGILINQFTGYQCAYPSGACLWDGQGALQNTAQSNCVPSSKCKQGGSDS